ncbi:DUF3060 domain-containing protein [Nocardiopsis sp. EMB25]|uniref:DUF3060 domain-containing protein n=1 Tax=Nocardiopsis TaxID=2013 RepID=UPI000344AA9D|nr:MULTISPECIES: DUF3060 domain-containing protein [Nocardiopsis]MCY9783002.1 DUF3060 domain-containing protein [Nocardiopsis sp. EMB25]
MKVQLLATTGVLLVGTSFLVGGCSLVRGGAEAADSSDVSGAPTGADPSPGPVSDEDTLVVADDGAEVRQDCGDREIVVSADDAVVVLDGACGLVRATGRGTTVDVGSAERIVLVGVDNTVSFAAGEPEVINHGRNTSVVEGGVATASPRRTVDEDGTSVSAD